MNRCRIYRPFLRKVVDFLGRQLTPQNFYDYNKKERRVFEFIEKWRLSKKNGKVYHKGLEVIPYEDTESILKKEATYGGMPLSRDGAMAYLGKRYIGFKKVRVMDWLRRIEQLQLIHRRSDVARAKPSRRREGATNWRMMSANEGRFNLGVDLFDIPKEWSAYKFFFVAVLQKSGYTWLVPMTNKKAVTARTCLKQVFRDCKMRFGSEPTGVTSDKGGEFKGEFGRWLNGKGVKQKFEKKLCSWVEKKNSTMARTFAVMREIHGFKKALDLTLLKINSTVSRKTRKAPVDWTHDDFLKKTKRYNRKIKATPKRRVALPFDRGDRVRQMLKQAVDKGGFYKSYEGMRKKSHWMWSRKIYKVIDKKSSGPGLAHRYKIDNPHDTDWIPHRELQLIEGKLIRLSVPKPLPIQKPKRPKKAAAPKVKKAPAAPILRRSTRIRKAPTRFGFS